MPYLSGIEEDFVLDDLKVFREFDISHFISNAKTAISGKAEIVKLDSKFDYYTSTLERAINTFQNIVVDSEKVRKCLSEITDIDSSKLMMNDINSVDVISIRPQYIGQYTTLVGEAIDKVLKGVATLDDNVGFLSGEYPLRVRRQVVKTTLPYDQPAKELIKITKHNLVPVNGGYIKTHVIPFVTNYNNLQHETITEATATLNAIKEAEITMKGMLKVLNKKKMEGELTGEQLVKVNQISYNAIRGLLDVVSYTTYMTIRKLNIVSDNIIACNKLCMTLNNMKTLSGDITESFKMDGIIPTDTNNLAEEMISGNVGGFEDLANRIYQFHVEIPGVDMNGLLPDNTDSNIKNFELGQRKYDSEVYRETNKIFDSISGGLDSIAAVSDEYLMVFDDIVNDAGFTMSLEDSYKNWLDNIDDISEYQGASDISSTGTGDKMVYSRILAEVKAFPELMQEIATNCLETKTKLDMLIKRFNSNINGEFKDAQAVNEIKIFLSGLVDQYQKLTNIICGKFMNRLILMGNVLSEIEASDESNNIVPDTVIIDTDSRIDFSESFRDASYDEFEEETNRIMNHLQMEFVVASMKKTKGIDVVFEADTPQPSTFNATGNKADTAAPTGATVSVTDNAPKPTPQPQPGQPDPSNVDVSGKYKSTADEFMNKVKKKSSENLNYIKQNKDDLQNRSYSNVSINRVISNVDDNDVIKSLNNLAQKIESLSRRPSDIQAIKSMADVPGKLQFNELSGLNPNDDIKQQAINYFTSGSVQPPQSGNIANSELKTYVIGTVLPRAEAFYPSSPSGTDGTANQIKDAVYKIGDAMTSLKTACSGGSPQGQSSPLPSSTTPQPTQPAQTPQPTVATASAPYDDITGYSIFSEEVAELNATPGNNKNANTKASMNSAYSMVDKFVTAVCGAAMNARYNFNNGDMKVLSGLEQKSSVEPAKSNSEKIEDKEPVTTHPQQPVTQPQTPQPVNASVDTLDIIDSELMAESMLRDIERYIGIE